MHNKNEIEHKRTKNIFMEITYGHKEFEESERYRQMLMNSGEREKLFAYRIDEIGAIIESLEPPRSNARYNHIRLKVIKGKKQFRAWFQARQRDNFSQKYIEPLENSLEAIIKHHLTPGDYVVVKQLECGKTCEEVVGTLTEAFDRLFVMIRSS